MKMSNFNGMGYAFEPVRDRPVVSDYYHMEDDQFPATPLDRLGGSDWCVCGRCRSMDTAIESICCREVNLDHLLMDVQCITMHRSFRMLCGEREVLEVAMLSLRDVQTETLERPVSSRLTAYQQFTLWARGHLGRRNRIPIPSCAVNYIRDLFPSAQYQGFEYALDL
ncbi:P2X purinoceptor 7-like [Perca fluviatilis]|uniref:P2X purinoceptor 7-like n=1 Tax=Perca fluviatilis TaxID=8168 RepID=UPI00196610CA|nr:P2X purinoceptor 7-like [Perca fluviatilis]